MTEYYTDAFGTQKQAKHEQTKQTTGVTAGGHTLSLMIRFFQERTPER